MSRVELVSSEKAGLLAKIVYWFSRRKFGRVLSSTQVVAHHPRVLSGVAGMEGALSKCNLLPERLKTLAAIKAAMMVGCPF